MRISVPNQITLVRLGLALVFFALLSLFRADDIARREWILEACFWIFLLAALGDVLDGYLARSMNQVTSFGRIVDPVVDKIMVLGAFIFLASDLFYDPARKANVTGVAPWMVVVLLLREMFVSAVRAYSESGGQPYAALWTGKLKMFVQCTAVCVVLGQLAWFRDNSLMLIVRTSVLWLCVIVTVGSIFSYVQRGRQFLLSESALCGQPVPPRRTKPRAAGEPERPAALSGRAREAAV